MLCCSLQKAVELMSLVPKRCNDMMNLGRLQGYEVHESVNDISYSKCDTFNLFDLEGSCVKC